MPDLPAMPGYTPVGTEMPLEGGGRARAVRAAVRRIVGSWPVRWGFGVAAIAIGGYAVARRWPEVRAALASIGPLATVGAMISVLLAMLATMQVWRVMLTALGSSLRVRVGARIMFVGQLGKYLPGSVWPVLAQMELGAAHRVPRHHSASASVLTLLVSTLTGLLTALVTLPFVAGSTPYLWAFLAAPILLACLHPRIVNSVLARVFRLLRRPALEQPLTARVIVTSLAWSFGSWICYGLQIWLLATPLGAPPGEAALLCLGGFAFAWSVGFLAVFAPAGAGVREVLLVALLGPVIGVGGGTAVALLSRVLTTAGDVLAAAVAAGFSRRIRSPSAAGPGESEAERDPPGADDLSSRADSTISYENR